MTFDDLVMNIARQLKQRYDDPQLQQQAAWWIIEALTEERKEHLIAQKTFGLTEEQEKKLSHWLEQLITKRMPLQYLLGSVPFNDIEILVQPPVLIPRPETEEWVLSLIEQLNKLSNQKLTIVDLCTGSGCIALAIAHALPHTMVYGTDISQDALMQARHNATHNGISNVQFIHSDLFQSIGHLTFDLIIANPPYIDEQEWHTLDASVTDWEDKIALVANDTGYAIIEAIIESAPAYLAYNKELADQKLQNLWIEIGHEQGQRVDSYLKQKGYSNICIQKDLEAKDRVAKGFWQAT